MPEVRFKLANVERIEISGLGTGRDVIDRVAGDADRSMYAKQYRAFLESLTPAPPWFKRLAAWFRSLLTRSAE